MATGSMRCRRVSARSPRARPHHMPRSPTTSGVSMAPSFTPKWHIRRGAPSCCATSPTRSRAVAAVLLHEAIGDQLTCIFVDTGLLRAGEAEEVVDLFRRHYNIPLVHRDA